MLQNRANKDFAAMMKSTRLGLVTVSLLSCVMLSACRDGIFSESTPGLTPKERFPITVTPQVETLSLLPDPVTSGLGDANAARVGAFASHYMRAGHGPLIVESASAKITKQTFEQIKAINTILAERGVPVSRLEWRTAKPSAGTAAEPAKAAASPLVLSYTRYVASSPDCGDWSEDAGSTQDNQPTANFGCAMQHNLAVSIADPLDLKRPRGTDPVDPVRRAIVMGKYRAGEATAAPRSADESGTSSSVSP